MPKRITTIRLLYTLKDVEKHEWLVDSDDSTIETLDADYEDIDS